MLKDTSKEFRAFFLLQFTRELIKHSVKKGLFELENVLKEEKNEIKLQEKERKKNIHEKIQLRKKLSPSLIKSSNQLPRRPLKPLPKRPALIIPQQKLPQRLQYIRPTPTAIQIDLGKLNSLIKDPLTRSIECNGADKNILTKGATGQAKTTNIILNDKEVTEIIEKFSTTAKIPVEEGVFKVVVGKLILSAIVSEVIGSKFIIKKMTLGQRTGSPAQSMLKKPRGYR